MWFLYTLVVLLAIIGLWVCVVCYKRRQYPNGPFPLPLIGNLHLLRKDIHLSMDALSKQYGNMFTLWMAHIPYIVITDVELARRVCLTKTFADRLPLYIGSVVYTRGAKDIIMADYGPQVVLHRKLAHSAFKMFGDGMVALEDRILTNVDHLLGSLELRQQDECYNLATDVELACFNVLSSFVFGNEMEKNDPRFLKIRNAVYHMLQSGVTFSLINFYPFLRHFPNKDLQETYRLLDERDTVLKVALQEAKDNYKLGEKRNYIQALLQAQHELEESKGEGYTSSFLSTDHLEMNIFDMFLGGIETVTVTLQWAIMYLIKWPHIQIRCQQEIDRVMGCPSKSGCNRIELNQKRFMPYIQATILETLRLASPLPFGVFHKAREDTELNGYKIKKGKCAHSRTD